MSIGVRSDGTRAIIDVNSSDKLAINQDGSVELLTPPSVPQEANDLVTAGNKLQRGTAQSASGTAINFTDIPSWAKRVTVLLDGVSTSGTSIVQFQLGTTGGVETAGYSGSTSAIAATTVGSSVYAGGGIPIDSGGGNIAAAVRVGRLALEKISGDTWIASYAGSQTQTVFTQISAGRKALSGALDRIRLTTVNGTDTFDAGTVNIMWE